jgi:hypothetical protein
MTGTASIGSFFVAVQLFFISKGSQNCLPLPKVQPDAALVDRLLWTMALSMGKGVPLDGNQ